MILTGSGPTTHIFLFQIYFHHNCIFFFLRGLCVDSRLPSKYIPMYVKGRGILFRATKLQSEIAFDQNTMKWIARYFEEVQ